MKKVKQIINNIHSSSAIVSEPDLQKVLDYYMNNQVVEQINTTIIASSSLNYGNVYYISAASGNNTTAVKGDPQKPYATFATVAALYQNGEIIHIIDGIVNASSVTDLNNKTNIKIILNEFTTLQNFSFTPSVTGFDVSILGNGTVSGGTASSSLSVTGTYTVNVNYLYNHKIINKGGTFNFTANKIEFISSESVLYGDSDANSNTKDINIVCNDLVAASETFKQSSSGSDTVHNVVLNVNAKKIQLNGTGINVIWSSDVNNVSINFKADVWVCDSNYLFYWQGDGKPFSDCAVNVYIGYYKGTASLFGYWGPGEHPSGQGLNSSFKIHADFYHCTKANGSVVKNHTNFDKATQNYFFEISGFFISDTVPILRLTETMLARYRLSGTFKITGAVPAFNLTSIGAGARLNLENAKFIVASGQKVIEATGASNVYCMNVVTNSTTTDAEVTEVGQAIVRNANFL